MKIRNTYKLLLLSLLLACSFKSVAQFTLSAEVRPRSEFRNGFKTPKSAGQDPAFFTEQRSRIYFDYVQPKYHMKVAFQDVRFWGETTQIFKREVGTTFLSEAWGEVNLSDKTSLKLGRQIISYDNERFLGGLEWAQQGRRHDAALLKIEDKTKKSKFHLGLALNADQDVLEPALLQKNGANFYSVGGQYKSMQYGWFHKDFNKAKFSLLALNAGTQSADSTVAFKQTFGFIGSKEIGKVSFATDVYYQTGKIGKNKVNAFLAGINATFKTKVMPITLGYEYISGKSDDDKTATITNFSPDYGTNHAFNGFMDYFFVGPANGNVGVQDINIKTKFKLGKGFLMANGHEFLTGSTQLLQNGQALSKAMGTEIDLVYAQKITSDLSFNIGFSQLFATDTMLSLRGQNLKSNNWAWVMITFNPVLFKSDK